MNDFKKNRKPNWTIILYKDAYDTGETSAMACPNCGHHLLQANHDSGVIVNQDESVYVQGAGVPMIKFKCGYCKAYFTVITQYKEE